MGCPPEGHPASQFGLRFCRNDATPSRPSSLARMSAMPSHGLARSAASISRRPRPAPAACRRARPAGPLATSAADDLGHLGVQRVGVHQFVHEADAVRLVRAEALGREEVAVRAARPWRGSRRG
jgi:hypothetical protein